MSLSQIETFVTVVQTKSMSRAAERLHVAQPALSRQIKSLEEELGTRLFARTSRGMALLPEGEIFLEHARRILDEIAAARRRFGAAK
ncbi:MAG TPA: LysR family transcriptional regulator [Labilithrix sp.]